MKTDSKSSLIAGPTNAYHMTFRAAFHSTLRNPGNIPRVNKEACLGDRVKDPQGSQTVEFKKSHNISKD